MISIWSDAMWIPVIWLLFSCVLMIRNFFIYEVRINFIFDKEKKQFYELLPSYAAMMVHPRYFLIWTTNQWMRYMVINHSESFKYGNAP